MEAYGNSMKANILQSTKTCKNVKETRRIKRGDAIKMIETVILANSRIKRKEQSDKQFEYTKKRKKKIERRRKSNDNDNNDAKIYKSAYWPVTIHHSMTKSNEKLFDFLTIVHCVKRKQKKKKQKKLKHFT